MRTRENEIGSTLITYTKELASATSYVLSDFQFRLVLKFNYEIDTINQI